MKTSAFSVALWAYNFIHLTNAIPWLEPAATPTGYMNVLGFSPMPTQAPGLPAGVPKELLRRQASTIPDNWCGFVNGDVNDVLSCNELYTCVYSSTAVGCCGAGLIDTCTALFTTCSGLSDPCGVACSANNKVLKCTDNAEPYCAIYTFAQGKINYNCAAVSGVISSVAFISDVLATLSGAYVSNQGPITITGASQVLTQNRQPATSGGSFPTPSGAAAGVVKAAAISISAIIGIAIGAVILLGAIAIGIFIFCCLRRRKRRNNPPAPATQPPMAHQPAPSTYTGQQGGAYAPVPPGPPQDQFQQQTGYFPPQQQQQQYVGAGAAASYYPAKPQDVPPQYSQSEAYSGPRDSVFKPPQSPPPQNNVTEIAGTPIPGQGPSRVTSPVPTTVSSPGTQYPNLSAQAGPVYEMPQSDHR